MSFAEDSYTPTLETKHMLKIKGLDFEEEGTYTNAVGGDGCWKKMLRGNKTNLWRRERGLGRGDQ